MSDLQLALRKLIAEEYQKATANAGQALLGFVNSLNDDGTANVLTTFGTQIIATPLYPTVKGQKVIVISTGGLFRCAPTSPNAPPAAVLIPPFFTGGAILAAFPQSGSLATGPFSIRFQAVGSNKIFTWPILPQAATPAWSSFSAGSFSPGGRFFGYAGQMQWNTNTQGPVNLTDQTKLAVVSLGAQFSSSGPIVGFPNGFFLAAKEVLEVFIPGFQIIASTFPVQGTAQAYNFNINSIYVSADGTQVFWTEFMQIVNAGTGVTANASNAINFCTLKNGVRTVLASFTPFLEITSGSPPVVSLQGTDLGGGFGPTQSGSFILDPTIPTLIALKMFGFPPASLATNGHSILDVFTLASSTGINLPPVLLELDFGDNIGPGRTSASQNLAPSTFSTHFSSVLDTTLVNASTPPFNPVVLIVRNVMTGALIQYQVIGPDNNPFGGSPGFTNLLFTNSNTLRAFLTLSDFNFNSGTRFILRKVTTDEGAKTIKIITTAAGLYIITPNAPASDALQNYSSTNFRMVNYGSDFQISSNLTAPTLGVR